MLKITESSPLQNGVRLVKVLRSQFYDGYVHSFLCFISCFPSPSLTISPVPQELPKLTSPVTFSEEGPLLSKCELYMVSL